MRGFYRPVRDEFTPAIAGAALRNLLFTFVDMGGVNSGPGPVVVEAGPSLLRVATGER
jgi:hypothetical protein